MPEKSVLPEKPAPLPADAILKNIQVAAPCSESWDSMPGGEKVRSCARCQHRVFNLSGMTAIEAAELLQKTEGRICVRFYRRSDGTVMTKDCPVGLLAVRRRIARAASIAFASVAVACGASYVGKPRSEQPFLVRWVMDIVSPATMGAPALPDDAPSRPAKRWVDLPTASPEPQAVMGDVAISPATNDKPFLHGLEKEIQPDPRPDPFVSLIKKASGNLKR